MFSQRTGWGFASNRLTLLLEEKKAAAEDIIDLTESNPTRAALSYPEEEILEALGDRRALVYEPSPHGLDAAREAVVAYYADRGRAVSRDDLLLTASTSEAYAFAFKVLLDPDEEVLTARPSYPLFDYLVTLEGAKAVSYPLVYDGSWSLDTAALEAAVTERTRAILVVHPANPTGSYIKPDELDRLRELCRRRGLALIVDEVFLDYPVDPPARLPGSFAGEPAIPTFVLSGLSKVAGLPQMKLAWLWVGGPEPQKREARLRLEHVSDVFLSVAAPVQHGLERLLDLAPEIQAAIRSRLAANYRFLRSETKGSAVEALKVEGGWTAVLRLPAVKTSETWAFDLLGDENVRVHPGYLFDFPAESYLVVSLLTPPAAFETGIGRLQQHVQKSLRALGGGGRAGGRRR